MQVYTEHVYTIHVYNKDISELRTQCKYQSHTVKLYFLSLN